MLEMLPKAEDGQKYPDFSLFLALQSPTSIPHWLNPSSFFFAKKPRKCSSLLYPAEQEKGKEWMHLRGDRQMTIHSPWQRSFLWFPSPHRINSKLLSLSACFEFSSVPFAGQICHCPCILTLNVDNVGTLATTICHLCTFPHSVSSAQKAFPSSNACATSRRF